MPAVVVDVLQDQHPRRRLAAAVHGGKAAGVWLAFPRGQGLVQPLPEEFPGVCRGAGGVKTGQDGREVGQRAELLAERVTHGAMVAASPRRQHPTLSHLMGINRQRSLTFPKKVRERWPESRVN